MEQPHRLLERQLKRYFGDGFKPPPEWHAFLNAVSDVYRNFDFDRDILDRSLVLGSQELHQSNAEMQAVFQAIPDLLFRLDAKGVILELKAGSTDDLLLPRRTSYLGKHIQDVPNRQVADAFRNAISRVLAERSPVSLEYSLAPHSRENIYEARLVPLSEDQMIVIVQNITGRKQAEARLKEAHGQLLEVSRMAGMAEVAISVLHNVGNVLNSVNISCNLLSEMVRNSKVASLVKATTLMREHTDDLADFLVNNPRGRLLPAYLNQLTDALLAEQKELQQELVGLQGNIDHVKEIVAMQQNYAKVFGVTELLAVSDLVEDALRMSAAGLEQRHIRLVREFSPVSAILADKHRIMQILVNLIQNSCQALDLMDHTDKQVTLRIEPHGQNRVRISVIDNGIGITPENQNRIFQHGFTTRKNGHGFGLHSGALAAREIGGSLNAYSEGTGRGTTFTLELPTHTGEDPLPAKAVTESP